MKLFLPWLLLAILPACAAYGPMPVWQEPPARVIEARGMDRERLFRLTRTWLQRHLNSPGPVIQAADPENGTIVAHCVLDYPATPEEEIARIQYTVSFRIVAGVTAGRVVLRYDMPEVNVPRYYSRRAEILLGREYFGGFSRPPVSSAEFSALDRAFASVVAGLGDYLAHGAGP